MESEMKYALLIDADNISPKYINIIVQEAENYGIASIRRIYGDWTDVSKESWKTCLLDKSLSPIQQYSYTTGKNSSDSAMIIDAMDILYEHIVDGFIIASSDSDFTRLAVRLREAGKRVIGMGESKTPASFVKACEQFKTLDVLYKEETGKHASPAAENKKNVGEPVAVPAGRNNGADNTPAEPITSLRVIKLFIRSLLSDDEWLFLGDLGNMINKRYPDFDPRNYGYRKFSAMVDALPEIQSKKEVSSNGMTILVYIKKK
ncbi:MAG: NYN domain-containing protein [Hungatella sp.]